MAGGITLSTRREDGVTNEEVETPRGEVCEMLTLVITSLSVYIRTTLTSLLTSLDLLLASEIVCFRYYNYLFNLLKSRSTLIQ
jgi:hypothetical protein